MKEWSNPNIISLMVWFELWVNHSGRLPCIASSQTARCRSIYLIIVAVKGPCSPVNVYLGGRVVFIYIAL